MFRSACQQRRRALRMFPLATETHSTRKPDESVDSRARHGMSRTTSSTGIWKVSITVDYCFSAKLIQCSCRELKLQGKGISGERSSGNRDRNQDRPHNGLLAIILWIRVSHLSFEESRQESGQVRLGGLAGQFKSTKPLIFAKFEL